MDIIKIASFTLIALFIILVIKSEKSEIAVIISLVVGIIIFIFVASKIEAIVSFIQDVSNKSGIDFIYMQIIFKILGIAYISSFASEICKDAGENNLGQRVEFAGKVLILFLSIPILMSIFESILNML